jgi:hypothetical protein
MLVVVTVIALAGCRAARVERVVATTDIITDTTTTTTTASEQLGRIDCDIELTTLQVVHTAAGDTVVTLQVASNRSRIATSRCDTLSTRSTATATLATTASTDVDVTPAATSATNSLTSLLHIVLLLVIVTVVTIVAYRKLRL